MAISSNRISAYGFGEIQNLSSRLPRLTPRPSDGGLTVMARNDVFNKIYCVRISPGNTKPAIIEITPTAKAIITTLRHFLLTTKPLRNALKSLVRAKTDSATIINH